MDYVDLSKLMDVFVVYYLLWLFRMSMKRTVFADRRLWGHMTSVHILLGKNLNVYLIICIYLLRKQLISWTLLSGLPVTLTIWKNWNWLRTKFGFSVTTSTLTCQLTGDSMSFLFLKTFPCHFSFSCELFFVAPGTPSSPLLKTVTPRLSLDTIWSITPLSLPLTGFVSKSMMKWPTSREKIW